MNARRGKADATGRSSGAVGGRAGRLMRPPVGEPWIWITREIIVSNAYQSLGINARRLLDRLLIEHMNHAGTENGRLKATYAQLQEFGLTARCVAGAIAEVEAAGLVDVHRGGRHVATTYALTFYPLANGMPASNRWKLYRSNKIRKSTPTSEGNSPPHVKAIGARLPPQVRVVATPTSEGPSISRGGDDTTMALARQPWSAPTYREIDRGRPLSKDLPAVLP